MDLAQVGLGVAVRAGAPKPDVSTVEAFRRMLLRVKSINALSTTGLYPTDKLLPKLGIAAEVTRKIKDGTVATVVTGEVEIAIRPVSELVNVPGIDFVGQSLRRFSTFRYSRPRSSPDRSKWMPVND